MGEEVRALPERYSVSSKALDRAPGQDWIAVARKNGTNEFATAFVAQPLLYASVLNAPCIGVGRIAAFFAATSGMYDTIAFTHETKDGSKTSIDAMGRAMRKWQLRRRM
jgi:hypothetical protein